MGVFCASRDVRPDCWPGLSALPFLKPDCGTLSPFCVSAGYRIFAVSRIYVMLSSVASLGAELGSPAMTIICLPNAVMLCPDLGDGAGPIFWKEYHRRVEMRKAARSPRSIPSSVRPPKIYITSFTKAAACPSRGVGMNPTQSNWAH